MKRLFLSLIVLLALASCARSQQCVGRRGLGFGGHFGGYNAALTGTCGSAYGTCGNAALFSQQSYQTQQPLFAPAPCAASAPSYQQQSFAAPLPCTSSFASNYGAGFNSQFYGAGLGNYRARFFGTPRFLGPPIHQHFGGGFGRGLFPGGRRGFLGFGF